MGLSEENVVGDSNRNVEGHANLTSYSWIIDLMGLQALAAIWSGRDSAQIAGTLLDALVRMLRLDFAFVRLAGSGDGSPIELVRLARRGGPDVPAAEIGRAL